MTEVNKKNQPAHRRGKSPSRKATPERPLSEYTPQQRERIRKGLRILAKVIVRAHLRKQAGLSDHE